MLFPKNYIFTSLIMLRDIPAWPMTLFWISLSCKREGFQSRQKFQNVLGSRVYCSVPFQSLCKVFHQSLRMFPSLWAHNSTWDQFTLERKASSIIPTSGPECWPGWAISSSLQESWGDAGHLFPLGPGEDWGRVSPPRPSNLSDNISIIKSGKNIL